MARTTPRVEGSTLRLLDVGADSIMVETAEWYAWLDAHTTFTFASADGSFTARKERGRASGWYWKAYRKRAGKLFSAYLGRSPDLTLDRLSGAARTLAGAEPSQAPEPKQPVTAPPAHTNEAGPLAALLRTKFFIPPLRPQRVPRPRLLDRLRDDMQPLALVAAPAGYGKTTLVVDWIAADERAAAWLSLDTGDNDPLRFWNGIAAALEILRPGAGARVLVLLQSPQTPHAGMLLLALLNGLAEHLAGDLQGRPVLLVLDDYHVIENHAVHEILEGLLDRLPLQLRLVIVGRIDPPLPLPRLRVRNQLAEVRAADLAFTDAEVAAFLGATAGLTLDAELAATLVARTEGWVAALQLAALSLRGQANPAPFVAAFRGSNRQVLDYLVEEVLSQQLEFIQSFLLRTSILDRMCAELCDALLGLEHEAEGVANADGQATSRSPRLSQALLAHLELANLFVIPLDSEGRWYRYHQLFAEMLRQRLRSLEPDLEPELRRRASQWYARAGYMAEAIDQALATHDWDLAAELIEPMVAPLWRRSEFGMLEGWLDALPESVVRMRPRLGLARATVLCARGQVDAVGPLLEGIEQSLARTDAAGALDVAPAASVPALRARLTALRARVARMLGDSALALALAQQALAELPSDDDWRAEVIHDLALEAFYSGDLTEARRFCAALASQAHTAGNHYLALFGLSAEGVILLEMGHLSQARIFLEDAQQLAARWGAQDLPIAGYGDICWALVQCERNMLVGIEPLLLRAIERTHQGRLTDFEAHGYLALAHLRLAQGNTAAALQAVDQADALLGHADAWGQSAILWRRVFVSTWRARVYLAGGDHAAAAHWARNAAAEVDPSSVPAWSPFYRPLLTMLVRARLLEGRTDAALDLIGSWCERAEASEYGDLLIELLALEALALDQAGRRAAALAALERALALGAPEGYVRVFIDSGAPMAELLALVAGHRPRAEAQPAGTSGYAAMLLAAFPDFGSPILDFGLQNELPIQNPKSKIQNLVEPLTPRELEILRLVAEGCSNQEIAHRLVVAEETVKSHTKAIHSKLGVQRRTQAVARARELGLLP
jgi:ATP/maltotriose-dependent transcriptional regulator MalT